MKLSEALKGFQGWGIGYWAPATIFNYSNILSKFIDHVGDREVETITPVDVSDYRVFLTRRGYAGATVAYSMIVLRNLFEYLFLQRKINWDYKTIRVPRFLSQSHKPVCPTAVSGMLDSVRDNNFIGLRDRTIIAFLAASGVRNAELCSLTLSDLQLDKRYGVIISKKNLQRRMVFWDERAHKLLLEYLSEREKLAKSNYVFITCDRRTKGHKLTTRSIQRLIARYRTSTDVTPHSFRHALGIRAVKANLHPREIQKILGHKNINSSQIYMQLYDADLLKAYKKMACSQE